MARMFSGISIGLFFVLFIAFVGADEDCGEERVGACVQNLLTVLLSDIEEEQACVELHKVAKCLRSAADECLGEERDPEIDESLTELDNLLVENCPAEKVDDESDAEIDECVAENKEYLFDCISDSMREVGTLLGNPDEIDMDVMKCAMYSLMSECIVERTGEKCGEKARAAAQEEMADMPESIRTACSAQETMEFFSAELLDLKKKK